MYHRQFHMPQREKRRNKKTYENSEGASARAGGRSKLERWTVPQRRGKGEREEEPHALIYALRDLPRAHRLRTCVYMQTRRMERRDDGRQTTRGTEAKRWNKNKRKSEGRTKGRRGRTRADGRRRKKGVGTSDSNYLELRADSRPIRRPVHGGFLAARPRTP